MTRRSARLAALVTLTCTGCTAWHSKPLDGRPDITYLADPARVQLRDGSAMVLTDVRIARDTLTGIVRGTSKDSARVVRVPTREVASLRVREPSGQRTLGLAAAIGFVGTFVLGFLMFGGGG